MGSSDSIFVNTLWFSQDFIDLSSGFVNFTDPRFINLLEDSSETLNPFPHSVMDLLMRGGGIWQMLMAEYFMFFIDIVPGVHSSGVLEVHSFGNRMPFTNKYGELYVFKLFHSWALNSAATSTQQALALDFIRFIQDPVHMARLTTRQIAIGRLPINRARFEYEIKMQLDAVTTTYERSIGLVKPRQEVIDYLFERVYYSMNRPMAMLPSIPMPIMTFFNELWENLNQGIISPHEAATALQNRVVLEILEGN